MKDFELKYKELYDQSLEDKHQLRLATQEIENMK